MQSLVCVMAKNQLGHPQRVAILRENTSATPGTVLVNCFSTVEKQSEWTAGYNKSQSIEKHVRESQSQISHDQSGEVGPDFRRFANKVGHSQRCRFGAVPDRCVGRGFFMNSDCSTLG